MKPEDKNIEKWISDKLAKVSTEYHDSYWEEARMYIRQQEGRRRRKVILWWTLGLLLFTSASVGVYLLSTQDKSQPVTIQDQKNQTLARTGEHKKAADPSAYENYKGSTQTSTQSKDANAVSAPEAELQSQPDRASDKVVKFPHGAEFQSGTVSNHAPESSTAEEEEKPEFSISSPKQISTKTAEGALDTVFFVWDTPTPSTPLSPTTLTTDSDPTRTVSWNSLTGLPAVVPLLENSREEVFRPLAVQTPSSRVAPEWMLSLGTGAGMGKKEGQHTYTRVGLQLRWPIASRLRLLSQLDYLARFSDDFHLVSRQTDYHFDFERTEQRLRIQQMHYLQLGFSLEYPLTHRLSVSMGAQGAYLLNAYAAYDESITSPRYREVMNEDQSFGYTEGLGKWDLGFIQGLRYRIGYATELGMELRWGLNDLTDNDHFHREGVHRHTYVGLTLQQKLGRI